MSLTIASLTDPAESTTPLAYSEFRGERLPATQVRRTMTSPSATSATLREAGLRTGSMSLVYPDTAAMLAAVALLGSASAFVLTDTEHPALGMTFVIPDTGQLAFELDRASRRKWTVSFPWAELPA